MTEYDHQYTGTLPVLPVADVRDALAFFVQRLGFEQVFVQEDRGVLANAQVQMDGCHLMLNHNPERSGERAGGVYFWIRVRDQPIDELYRRHADGGVRIAEEIADQFWGDRSYVAQDANGFMIAFTQAASCAVRRKKSG